MVNIKPRSTQVQRNWFLKMATEKGPIQPVNLAGPFIMSSKGKP